MPKDWKKYERHPLSDRYPDITGEPWEDFLENARKRGVKGRKIVVYQKKILEGWQLYRACLELDIKPTFVKLPAKEDPEAFVVESNEQRRHESMEDMKQRRAKRLERAGKAQANGESVRDFAKNENISKSQAARDFAEQSVPGGTPKPTKTRQTSTKKDENNYPSQTSSILCVRCQRVGAVADCPACKEAQKGKKPPRKVTPPPDAGDAWEPPTGSEADALRAAEEIRDDLGYTIPKKLRDTFGDTFLKDAVAKLKEYKKHLKNNQSLYPWASLAPICTALDDAVTHLEFAVPHCVHQDCEGKGCQDCRKAGWLPEWRKVELEAMPK